MADNHFSDIEFIRDAFVLVPGKGEKPHQTVLLPSFDPKKKDRLFCSCSTGRTPKCPHAKKLSACYAAYAEAAGSESIDARFQKSAVRRLFSEVNRARTNLIGQLTIEDPAGLDAGVVVRSGKYPLITYHANGPDRGRFIGRIRPHERFSRAWLMEKALSFVESEYEKTMREEGHATIRQLEEGGVWYRIAYHCFREFAADALQWRVDVDSGDGTVRLHADAGSAKAFTVQLPDTSVAGVIDMLERCGNAAPLQSAPAPVERELMFRIVKDEGEMIRIVPVIDISNSAGRRFAPVRRRLLYNHLGYVPENGQFVRFNLGSLQRLATGWGEEKRLTIDELSEVVAKHIDVFSIGRNGNDAGGPVQTDLFGARECDDLRRIVEPTVVTAFDRVELHPRSVSEGRWTIAVTYRCGDRIVGLGPLLEARRLKRRFAYADGCLVDLKSAAVAGALAQARGIGDDGAVSLSNVSLLLLRGGSAALHFEGDDKLTKRIKQLFSGRPHQDFSIPSGLRCTLRDYQRNGVTWMLFLYDYFLGGLLCDEMGLGKTVEIIAFFLAVKEQRCSGATCFVVCPTSVVSHWKRLADSFAPALRVTDYATERGMPGALSYDLLITSYGIMRNDIHLFETIHFDIVVCDEAHQLKNRDTAGYRAACRLRGRIMVGLTGTPVENSIEDLRSLFGLVLPGLSMDPPSEEALLRAVDASSVPAELIRFRRRIEPFMLRRCKDDVLAELPPKMEENRFCALGAFQRQLYEDAIVNRGGPLVEALKRLEAPVPYMHIFALLTFLKQLCDSPALAGGTWEEYPLFESGKWELFKELLDESLESGEKVVVFTQFLGMVEIFKHYLASIDVGFTALTGSSKEREKIIRRFADDDKCRVFIGSLKAGGLGIDLVAASVVIHFDRWWNAAREDQATDRVHRIGQKRGVQVLKLITGGTIEERIDRIIERKRTLARVTLSEDDPESVKRFSRQELIEILSL
ncbi:MAG: DEAD/DEAH box helicase [Chitinispirillaceae bacterium]|nr:DEAD/DEAH box helicase [Chitinispirillaceae bacterium]